MTSIKHAALAVAISFFALPTRAEFFDENTFVQGKLCVGSDCTNGEEITSGNVLKLDAQNIRIQFKDTSSTASFPFADWGIQINDTANGGQNFFAIDDPSANTMPFKILNNAPDGALFVNSDGKIGFGTSSPVVKLHAVSTNTPTLRLEQRGGEFPPFTWDILANENVFSVRKFPDGERVMTFESEAPIHSLFVDDNGSIGLGTESPQGKLHTRGNGVQLAYFESSNGGPVQIRMRSDSQNRRFLAVNNANEVKSQIIFGDNDIRFTGATDSGANRWLTIGPAGIISQGPTCSGAPCDRTFDPEFFEVPPIEERAAYMWDNMHLPAVGPTSPDAPFNLTEKAGGMLHELEVAHIYIEQLHDRLAKQEARNDDLGASVQALAQQVQTLTEALAKP